MSKFKLETQLFFLYFTPIFIAIFISFGIYVILFQQIKNILNNQERQIYFEQQTSKKQILLGLKTHLDQSFSLQSQEYLTLSRFTANVFESNIKLNLNFIAPILNLERLYQGEEEKYWTDLYNKNEILASVWVMKEVKNFEDLQLSSQDQFYRASIVDILVRSFNLLNVQRTFQTKDQFTGFQLDGGLIANPAFNQSMNESFKNQTLCPGKLYYQSTCRIWYNLASQSEGTIMPSPFKVLTTKIPYMSLSLCRKTNTYGEIHSIACLSFDIEQLVKVFSSLEIQTGTFSAIHPVNDSLIYQKEIKDYQQEYSWKQYITKNMTSLEKDNFISQMEQVLSKIKEQNKNGVDKDQYNQLFAPQKVNGFEFSENSNQQYCLLLPIQIADKLNGENDISFSNIIILIYVFKRSEMINSFADIQNYMENIFMVNLVINVLILIFLLIVVLYYAKKASQLIELPIQDLISKLETINMHLDDEKILSQENLFIEQNQKLNKNQIRGHTCLEITKLKEYISNIQKVFNFNISFCNKVDETNALFQWVKAIKILQPNDDNKALGSLFNNIANIHFKYVEALDCFHLSLVYLESEECELLQKEIELKQNKNILLNPGISKEKIKQNLLSLMNKCFNKKQQSSIADGVVKDTFALNIKNRIMELKSLKFDRLYAYSQVLLACSLQGEIESSQNSSCKILELKSQNHCLFKIVSSGELNNCFSERNINDNSRAAQTRIQTQSSLLKEHLSILFKLRKIAFELDNDEQRYILINLELCQEMMLKKKYQKGKKYLDSAFSYFLVLYKKSRFRMMQVPSFYENSNSATHFQNYVQYIQAILTSRFSAEQLMEESSSLTRYRNCTFPRFSQQQFFKQITQATQISQIPFISSRPTIQPIIEDYMESIEDNANRQQHQIQNFVSFDKIQSNQTNGGQKNIRISKRSCSLTPFAPNHPIILKEYLISQKNFQIQNTNESNKEKKVPNKEDNVTKKKNIRDFKVSSNSPTNGVECLPQTFSINPTPTEYFATSSEGSISSQRSEMLSPPDELTQQFSTHQNVVIQADKLQPQEEILNMIDKGRIQSTSFTSWPQKTSFSMPLDILFSKIQIYEAVLEIKIGNQFKGCLLLTESIENSPRYLPSDRLLSLQILECVMKNFQEEKACITKHIMKFNNTKLNISVILNCTTNLKDICKQLYEVHSLCNIFGLVVVNERVEQFVTPRNQQSFIGEKNFIENTFKYLQNKVISQQMYHFHQALVKGSAQFHQERKQNDGNQIKNFLLIIESTDCTLKQEHFDHNIFTELNQQKVKVLVYLPSYDKQQFTLNISRLDLPFKIRFFYLFQHLIDYLCRKSFKFCTTEPILIEKV